MYIESCVGLYLYRLRVSCSSLQGLYRRGCKAVGTDVNCDASGCSEASQFTGIVYPRV